jgi:flavorubredoxin
VSSLRWITFGHVESDECGAMNQFLGVAPAAQVAHGALGCMVSIGEMADRPPRAMADGEVLEIGAKRLRHIDTPHVPHGWEARVLFEETTGTLLCGDLFTRLGDGPAVTDDDIVGPALEAEDLFRYSSLSPNTADVMRTLGDLAPVTLGLMHGSSFSGDGKKALWELAAAYESR